MFLIFFLLFSVSVNSFAYGADYYEKYNPAVQQLSNSYFAKHINFFIQNGALKADGRVYRLRKASDVNLDLKQLKAFDLQTVAIKINSRYYKSKPSFKKLVFVKRGKKGIFGYTIGRELILVYIPYGDKIKVLGVILQGEFFQENNYKVYDLNRNRTIKKQILFKILTMLGCKELKSCSVKSDKDANIYFYKGNKLLGLLQNYGDEKILIQNNGANKKHIATIKAYENKIFMEDLQGNILYQSKNTKTINIRLKTLDYVIEFELEK